MDKDGFGLAGSVEGRALFAAQIKGIRRRFRHGSEPGKAVGISRTRGAKLEMIKTSFFICVMCSLLWVAGVVVPDRALAQKATAVEKISFGIPAMDAGFLPLFVLEIENFLETKESRPRSFTLKPISQPKRSPPAILISAPRPDPSPAPPRRECLLRSFSIPPGGRLFFLIAEPNIVNVKDLKGRIIGVQDFAGGTNAYARIILQAHALTPDRDVDVFSNRAGGADINRIEGGTDPGSDVISSFQYRCGAGGI